MKTVKRVLVLVVFVIGVVAAVRSPFFRGRDTSQDDYGYGDGADHDPSDSPATDVKTTNEKPPGKDVARVMVKCPETGKSVFTGLWMEKETFKFAAFSGGTISPCPACGKAHPWEKEDAFLAGN